MTEDTSEGESASDRVPAEQDVKRRFLKTVLVGGAAGLAAATFAASALSHPASAAETNILLTELADVTITSAAKGHILRFSGTQWVNERYATERVANDFAGASLDVMIENAIADVAGGDKILIIVLAGAYTLAGRIDIGFGAGSENDDVVLWFEPGVVVNCPANVTGILVNASRRVSLYGNGLQIIGTGSATTGVGIEIFNNAADCVVSDVLCTNHQFGFRVWSGSSKNAMVRCKGNSNVRHGFLVSDSTTKHNKLVECLADGNTENGFEISAPNTQLDTCTAINNKRRGIVFEPGSGNSLGTNLITNDNGKETVPTPRSYPGLYVNDSDVVVSGVISNNNGQTSADPNVYVGGVGVGVFALPGANPLPNKRVQFSNVRCEGNSDNGVDIHGDDCIVDGGVVGNSWTDGVSITGSRCIVGGLRIFDSNKKIAGTLESEIRVYRANPAEPIPSDNIIRDCIVSGLNAIQGIFIQAAPGDEPLRTRVVDSISLDKSFKNQGTDTRFIDSRDPTGNAPGEALVAMWDFHKAKTNIGSSFVDIYNDNGADGNSARVDFTGRTKFAARILWNRIGSGTQNVRCVDRDNLANVLFDEVVVDGANTKAPTVLPSWATGVKNLKLQAKSTTTMDDPVFRGCSITLF